MKIAFTLTLGLLLPIAAGAVIVDRVAVSVGDRIITDSEIDLRIRLAAFQNDEKPDFNPDSRRKAVKELIDQKLIEHEMDLGHYPRLAEPAREALLDEYRKADRLADQAALTRALAAYGLTPQQLEDELAWQSDLLTFLNLRFRPAVEVTDEDVRKYLDEHVLKSAENTPAAALEAMRVEVAKKLTNERSGRELDLWLQDQLRRTKIDYLEKDLEAQ